jgi:DNA-binding transcriptional ArsR family regulator
MSSIFPLRETVSLDSNREPRLVELDDETADEVFEVLASGTTREMFLSLHEQPQAASDLAEQTDTSVQNAQYHLEKLSDADLIEVVDTWYSERGSEMKVYAPCDDSLVLFAGEDTRGSLERILTRLVGALAFLAPASALVWWIANRASTGIEPRTEPATSGEATAQGEESGRIASQDADGGDGATEDAVDTDVPTDGADGVVDSATEAIVGLDPAAAVGLGFFLGGLLVLTVLTLTWYLREW